MLDNYNIRTATINDMKPIFELSNDESVRSNSINTKDLLTIIDGLHNAFSPQSVFSLWSRVARNNLLGSQI